jgi:hypothetical protein
MDAHADHERHAGVDWLATKPDGYSLGVQTADDRSSSDNQINIPPSGPGRLWVAVAYALRCPACDSLSHKAETGKRVSREGLSEHYRRCADCRIRFRVVWE